MVWTLNIATNDSFTFVPPENAIVVDLSDIPIEIAGNSITMPPVNQSVSYTPSGRGAGKGGGTEGSEYLPILAGLDVVEGFVYALWRKKRVGT